MLMLAFSMWRPPQRDPGKPAAEVGDGAEGSRRGVLVVYVGTPGVGGPCTPVTTPASWEGMDRTVCWWGLGWGRLGTATGCEGSKDSMICSSDSVEPAIDLVTPVPASEARAGVTPTQLHCLGRVGGWARWRCAPVNDRARFVVQGLRDDGGYFVQAGGGVDADVVRPAGARP